MLPYHTVTASALMTSMLSLSSRNYAWLSEGIINSTNGFRKINVFICNLDYFCLVALLILHKQELVNYNSLFFWI
jgi:hypothetical protein